jgi:hypothetical protein
MNRFRPAAGLALVLALAVLGCGSKPSVAPAEKSAGLPFIENDFPRALAQARESKLPLFVEVWAPW